MYIKRNTDARKRRTRAMLHEYYGSRPEYSREEKELADCGGEKSYEAVMNLRAGHINPYGYDELKIAVENMSGGANTVLYDEIGMPSIVAALPKQRICDLWQSESEDVHPAWIVDGAVKETIYISKYMNFVQNGRAYSLPMCHPHTYATFDDVNQFCQNKGRGWHLMTKCGLGCVGGLVSENGTLPRGNTGWGYAYDAPHEKGVVSQMFYHGGKHTSEVQLTRSGSGPVSWTHNHNGSGICDLVGNMFEWVGGLRLMDGVIQIIPEATAAIDSEDAYRKDSRRWRAITTDGELAAHGERNTLKFDSTVPGDALERDHLNGAPVLSTEIKNRSYLGVHTDGNQGYTECSFSNLKTTEGLPVPDMLKYLAVFPDENCKKEHGIFVVRNYGERMAVRGGKAGSFERAGINALHFYNPRTYDGSATIGFRSAFVEL